jgi:hypothetical protein
LLLPQRLLLLLLPPLLLPHQVAKAKADQAPMQCWTWRGPALWRKTFWRRSSAGPPWSKVPFER